MTLCGRGREKVDKYGHSAYVQIGDRAALILPPHPQGLAKCLLLDALLDSTPTTTPTRARCLLLDLLYSVGYVFEVIGGHKLSVPAG